MKKTLIFDFNGTMLLDTPLHKRAYAEFLSARIGRPIEEAEFDRHIIGRDNATILRHYFGPLTTAQVFALAEEKEAEYRRQCLLSPEIFHLTDGLEEFLDYLTAEGFRMTIATGAPRENLDFYLSHLGIARWFDPALIVYDDGSYPGKPEPDIYRLAMQRLGASPEACIVFEDSLPGVMSAHAAGIETVIAVSESDDPSRYASVGGVTRIIADFRAYRTFPLT